MVKLTRAQREALFNVFQRDFPSWISPTKRLRHPEKHKRDRFPYSAAELASFADRHPEEVVKVPSIQWRRFCQRVQGGPGCVMIQWRGMWLGIEPDGYTHS